MPVSEGSKNGEKRKEREKLILALKASHRR